GPRQGEAQHRQGAGVEEITPAEAVAERDGTRGVQAQHGGASPGAKSECGEGNSSQINGGEGGGSRKKRGRARASRLSWGPLPNRPVLDWRGRLEIGPHPHAGLRCRTTSSDVITPPSTPFSSTTNSRCTFNSRNCSMTLQAGTVSLTQNTAGVIR